MGRISERLKRGRGFIPFVTAGDPDLETSLRIIQTLAARGADVIELGVPFSDPMADGPTIQRSSERALANGVTLRDVITLAARSRETSDVPIVLFSYLNPIMHFGVDLFADEAAKAGIDALLVTDVVDLEAGRLREQLGRQGVDLISLVAPTTVDDRLAAICYAAEGFIYAVARAGVTGAQSMMTSDAERLVARIRKLTETPVAVGFGISTRAQVAKVWKFADAAVVGSAIVAEIERAGDESDAVERVDRFIAGLLPPVANAGTET